MQTRAHMQIAALTQIFPMHGLYTIVEQHFYLKQINTTILLFHTGQKSLLIGPY